MNLNEHVTQIKQFRQEVYQNFNKRADTLMNLLDALSSNTRAQSVVELSMNAAFQREYSALFTALDEWDTEKAGKTLAQLAGPYLPKPAGRPFWLIGTDVTPQPRVHAQTLEDRSFVHQPNTIKSNKPITIGHAYSSMVLFPEEENEHGPVWAVPLSVKRVKSSEDKEMVGALQVQTLLDDETLPFHNELCVEVEDSGYSKPAFLAKNRKKTNLITVTRARNKRTFYRQPLAVGGEEGAGHPTWYGAPFKLPNETTWHAPDTTTTTTKVSLSGKTYRVEIEGWNNMLMRGERIPVILPMHQHPFTLVRIRLFNAQDELAFQRPLWLIVMGERRYEITLLHIFQAYQRRYDIEHFFRFGKQRLLLDRYQTPETGREEKWWLMSHLAYLQLWIARTVAQTVPRPWEAIPPADRKQPLSATHVQRDFERIIRQIGTPAAAPKRRGNAPGRRKGVVLPSRPRPAVVYKGKT
jgi:hypothetical protein